MEDLRRLRAVLGADKNAGRAEIVAAYRRLARDMKMFFCTAPRRFSALFFRAQNFAAKYFLATQNIRAQNFMAIYFPMAQFCRMENFVKKFFPAMQKSRAKKTAAMQNFSTAQFFLTTQYPAAQFFSAARCVCVPQR